ncbi:MAG: glycyl-radical enzyme activating protein [Dehalococcoidia bacterium]|jgi:pyruvate formate lyase activating enzyme|nr:glycyl-radical enzyme activating protein [Dehalococcoidia bacterium]
MALLEQNARALGPADLSVRGLLLDIDRFASHDGPGIRSSVYLKGCPLSCAWCHSPESQLSHPELLYQPERCNGCALCPSACPDGALVMSSSGESAVAILDRNACTTCGKCVKACFTGALKVAGDGVSVGDVLERVRRDIPYFNSSGGGVTLSGGEPARQFDFSYNFLLACQQAGISTALETTGYARSEIMSALAEVTDLILYDVKFVDAAEHRKYTGVPNELILKNLRTLADTGHEIQVRVPCINGVNDSLEQIGATARLTAEVGLGTIVLLPYNSAAGAKYEWIDASFSLSHVTTQNEDAMNALADICRGEGLEVQIGG